MKKHKYELKVEWVGNEGKGTLNYSAYNRNYIISAKEKTNKINGSSDPSFLGDNTKYNPEELFLSSISSCHMLWYLHLCAMHQIIVIKYLDTATGIMEETENGSGKFTLVTLNPKVTVSENSMIAKAIELHEEANKLCFIANSCNFQIEHKPYIEVE